MPDPQDIERTRLRERQGAGARYDAPQAPAQDLLLARRGTAYFARQLNWLADADLGAPSTVAGQTRRHVVAEVAFQARRIARLVEAARKGLDRETLSEPDAQIEDMELAVSLPAHALRHLFKHSEVHLNVEWRDLSDSGWSRRVRSLDGEDVGVSATPLMRARTIWAAALRLGGRGRLDDLPLEVRPAAGSHSVQKRR